MKRRAIVGKFVFFASLMVNPLQSYGASPAIWDHTVFVATRHRWLGGWQLGVRLTIKRSWVRLPVASLSDDYYLDGWLSLDR